MTVSQKTFRDALFDPKLPVPAGLFNGQQTAAGNRFSVYQNNVLTSLIDALKVAFPLVQKLLGEDNFSQLAAIFVRAHPPTSPLMMHYGEELPAFLTQFESLKHIGYLTDCAHLDLALRRSYHAADALPLNTAVFEDADAVATLRVSCAPATLIIRSVWPLFDIWRYNMVQDADKPRATSQNVLVTRSDFDPTPYLLDDDIADWLETLNSGMGFDQAHTEALKAHPHFDLAKALTLALTTQALIGSRQRTPE